MEEGKKMIHRRMAFRVFALVAVFFIGSFGTPPQALSLENKLVIVTSFPKDLYNTIVKGFRKKHPSVKVEVLNKKTSAGIAYIRETASNPSDIFWASAPDAFEVLKDDNLLQKYQVKAKGIPKIIGAYPINDPDGYFKGFAAAGYGFMWNTRYLKAKKLPAPKEWSDLTKAVYHGHVGMSAPSRSGTTHLTVETILQGEGWEKGWATILAMAGNFQTVTERSFGVPDGVNNGQFGVGIVIDFFGLSSKASGFPVDFRYPTVTTLVPANVAIIKNAPHPKAAGAFIEFLLSDEGQKLLLDPKIRRLPIRPSTYKMVSKDFPNPFTDKSIGAAVKFDIKRSKGRYNLVNSLFDVMVTFRLRELRSAWGAIQKAEMALKKKPSAKAGQLLARARQLASAVPITEAKAGDPNYAGIFKKKRKKKTVKVPKRQAEVEAQWDAFAVKNYRKAKALAEKAMGMAN